MRYYEQPSHSSSHLHLFCRDKLPMRTVCDAVDPASLQVGRLPGRWINAWLVSDKKPVESFLCNLAVRLSHCLSQSDMKLKLVMLGSGNDYRLCHTHNCPKWDKGRLWYSWFSGFFLEVSSLMYVGLFYGLKCKCFYFQWKLVLI